MVPWFRRKEKGSCVAEGLNITLIKKDVHIGEINPTVNITLIKPTPRPITHQGRRVRPNHSPPFKWTPQLRIDRITLCMWLYLIPSPLSLSLGRNLPSFLMDWFPGSKFSMDFSSNLDCVYSWNPFAFKSPIFFVFPLISGNSWKNQQGLEEYLSLSLEL